MIYYQVRLLSKKHAMNMIVKIISVANSSVKYDLVGKLVEGTGLIRKDIVAILVGLKKCINQFKIIQKNLLSKLLI